MTRQQHSGNFKAPFPTNISHFSPGISTATETLSAAFSQRLCLIAFVWHERKSAVNPLVAVNASLCVLTLQSGKDRVRNLLWSCRALLKLDLALEHLANVEEEQYGINKMFTCIYDDKEQSAHECLVRGRNIFESYSIPRSRTIHGLSKLFP